MTPAAPTPAAPPRENVGNVTERQLRQLMDQTLSAAAIHGTDRVKAMLDALTHTTSPSPGSVPIGPQHGAAGSSNSSAGNTQPPARQQTAHGQHGQPQEGQNCEYPDLNRGQGNAQVPPTQPSYPPPRNGSEVWLGPQSAPTDIFAAMKAIFDNWHGQGNANTSPTQETGQSGRPMGDILLVTPTPATATAVGTTVGQFTRSFIPHLSSRGCDSTPTGTKFVVHLRRQCTNFPPLHDPHTPSHKASMKLSQPAAAAGLGARAERESLTGDQQLERKC
ncbi:uncharacterized protein LOC115099868 [Rhinatrema bivittatum]|uniref:uncharacterized protein LOC115099868 n=1 Tax=Rhinatrema bivittatum TaxID=194408 RepID=UPI00112DFECE|nr:uncharacterized protein LOC115099868 [Rhinatrema bivittatum]